MDEHLKSFKYRYAGIELYFGPGAISGLEDWLKRHERVLIVTGRRSAKESGALDDALKILSRHGVAYEVFSDVTPNPWASQADRMAERAWSMGAEAILAIGGGSVIDAAKVAAMIAVSGGRASDYVYGRRRARGCLPVYAINLTHGTGTEVDRYSVLTVDETREKRGMVSIYPTASVDDPLYTLTLPRDQTIYVSLDVFYHAYESATQRDSPPIVELLSAEAVRLLGMWLPRAVENLNDLEARYWLLYASMLAGVAIDISGTHVNHLLEHELSGANPRLAHGCGLALLGPRVVYYTHKLAPQASAAVLRALEPSIRPVPDDAEKAMRVVKEFQESVGFRERLSDYGFSESDLRAIARKHAGLMGFSEEQLFDILKSAA
ncbi:MAG: iron-containing alcohol dehydrogenase [Thermofilaceae archaeon]